MIPTDIEKNSQELLSRLAGLSEEELSRLVLMHNRKYFEENDPEISDEAFDKLVEALRFLNPDAEALSRIGHRREAMAKTSFGDEVIHDRPMLSLEKCYDDKTFYRWAEKVRSDFVAMPKIDGVACSIIYTSDGRLKRAATRGDGRVGEDITKNALLIADLPARLPGSVLKRSMSSSNSLEVRGEVFLPISVFKERFAGQFKSPRNLAAGFLKLKESDRAKNNFLKFFPYDVRGSEAVSEKEKFMLLTELGFSMMPWSHVKNDESATELVGAFFKNRDGFDFEIDGVVFRADSLSDQARLGETAHHPRYALAYKFQGQSAQTNLIGIEWSVARSGIITPIAIFEPVFVSGASLSRASLHNLRIMAELDLREHSLIEVTRRGGVIPHVERVLGRRGERIALPERCPSCGGPVIADGDFLLCQRPDECETVAIGRLVHFCHTLGIEGMGDKVVGRLFLAGQLRRLGDIFRLRAEGIASLDRMGDVLAKKLIRKIDEKRRMDLPTFLKALGIHEIGSNAAEIIAMNFHTLESVRSLAVEDLLPLHGIGERIAESLVSGLDQLKGEIDDLLTEIVVKGDSASASDSAHPLFQKSVVFTGKMAHLDRRSAQDEVKRAGGRTPGAISHSVDLLVIGDEGSSILGQGKKSTKQKEAEKLMGEGYPIRIISESEFLQMIGSRNG